MIYMGNGMVTREEGHDHTLTGKVYTDRSWVHHILAAMKCSRSSQGYSRLMGAGQCRQTVGAYSTSFLLTKRSVARASIEFNTHF